MLSVTKIFRRKIFSASQNIWYMYIYIYLYIDEHISILIYYSTIYTIYIYGINV